MRKQKQKTISYKEYAKKLEEIIAMGRPVADTLIDLIEEASKYKIKDKTK